MSSLVNALNAEIKQAKEIADREIEEVRASMLSEEIKQEQIQKIQDHYNDKVSRLENGFLMMSKRRG